VSCHLDLEADIPIEGGFTDGLGDAAPLHHVRPGQSMMGGCGWVAAKVLPLVVEAGDGVAEGRGRRPGRGVVVGT
jgi:hypothetical protein